MALSGTINGSVTQKSNYFSFYMTWSATQSVSGNYSDVTVKTYWKTSNTYQSFDTVGSRSASITINGVTASISKVFAVYWSSVGNPYLIQTATQRVYHNNDGAKSITISARANGHAAEYGPSSSLSSSGDCTASGTITLDTIPRASSLSISASSINVGNSITATITRASSSFTHTVEFYINSSYYQKYTDVATSQAYTIPTSWYNAMPSATSCTAYCRITTYNGDTQIGSQVTQSFTVQVPSSIIPTVGTITLTPQTYSYLVQGKNKLTVNVSGCSAGAGSSIKSYTFSGPSLSTTTTGTSVSSGIISGSGTQTYTVKVTDNRGRTASKTATITCYAYNSPSVKLTAYRSNSSGTEDNSGTYVKCSYTSTFSSVNSSNDVTIKILYKKNTATSYSSTTVLTDGTSTSGTKILSGIDLSSTYSIYATITDNYGGSSQSTFVTILSAERILNILKNGSGIAFGKMAESSNVLDTAWAIKTDKPEQTMKNLTYKGMNLLSTTDDTMENWADMGNLATVYYNQTGKLNGQPAQYGYLLNITAGSGSTQVHQLWAQQANGSLFHRGGNTNGLYDWKTVLDSSNYTSWVLQKPTTLYSSSSGTIGTIALSESAANFTYLEIFYTDNNSREPNSIKIYSPNGKYVSLSCIEPSTSGTEPRVYIRASGWTISDTSMTVGRSDLSGANRGVYGQLYPNANGTNIDVKVTENNYIKIFRILGYK